MEIKKEGKYWLIVGMHQGRDVAFQITVPEEYTESEAHWIGNMAQRAISGFFGYRDHEEKIRDFVNHVAIGIPKKYKDKKLIRWVQDSIGLAAATIMGCHAYEQDMTASQEDALDFDSPMGICAAHLGKKLDG